jgi:hypothetical protein
MIRVNASISLSIADFSVRLYAQSDTTIQLTTLWTVPFTRKEGDTLFGGCCNQLIRETGKLEPMIPQSDVQRCMCKGKCARCESIIQHVP